LVVGRGGRGGGISSIGICGDGGGMETGVESASWLATTSFSVLSEGAVGLGMATIVGDGDAMYDLLLEA
jgi:hypothetical protein